MEHWELKEMIDIVTLRQKDVAKVMSYSPGSLSKMASGDQSIPFSKEAFFLAMSLKLETIQFKLKNYIDNRGLSRGK